MAAFSPFGNPGSFSLLGFINKYDQSLQYDKPCKFYQALQTLTPLSIQMGGAGGGGVGGFPAVA